MFEFDLSAAHGFDHGERFHAHALFADPRRTGLEGLFNGDAAADDLGARLAAKIDQTEQRVALGKEIVNDEHAVGLVEIFFGNDHIVGRAVSKGLDLGLIHGGRNVFGFGLFCKQHRAVKILRGDAGDADAGGFDREDLVDAAVPVKAMEFFADFIEQADIHLMIQKRIHLQNVARKQLSVFQDPFLQKVHSARPPSVFDDIDILSNTVVFFKPFL